MTPPAAKLERVERLDADVVSVRERLARVEARMDAHELAAERRHLEMVAAIEATGRRMQEVEARAWKVAMALAAVGVGGRGVEVLAGWFGG